MRLPQLTLCLCLFFGSLIHASPDYTNCPARPIAPYIKLKTGFAPMASINSGNWPLALVDGKKVRAEDRFAFAFLAGEQFAPGYVEVTHLQITNWSVEYTCDYIGFSTIPTHAQVTADLTAREDIAEANLLFVVFDTDDDLSEIPAFAVAPLSLGKLKAGKTRSISVNFPPLSGQRRWGWSLLLFSGGQQIASSTDASPRLLHFLDVTERNRLQKMMAERCRGADAPVALFRKMPLNLPEALKTRYAGQEIPVILDINRDGEVTRIRFPKDRKDEELETALRHSLNFWLFLPPVKNGQEIGTTIQRPLPL